jgi:uncharacterized protein
MHGGRVEQAFVPPIKDFVDGRPEFFPVNYVVQHKTILFRTAAGTKLVSAAINNQVVFEVDDHTVLEGWSVIVKGTVHSVRAEDDIAEAERAHLLTWTESEKPHFMRVHPETVTGRRFQFIPERQQDIASNTDAG